MFDTALNEIKKLEKDMLAVIVLSPEVSHIDEKAVWHGYHSSGGSNRIGTTYIKVIDKEAVTEPDYDRRAAAEVWLQEIVETSPFYSLRYKAAVSSGMTDDSLVEKADEWMNELKQQLVTDPENAQRDLGFIEATAHLRDIRLMAGLVQYSEPDVLGRELNRNIRDEKRDADRTRQRIRPDEGPLTREQLLMIRAHASDPAHRKMTSRFYLH